MAESVVSHSASCPTGAGTATGTWPAPSAPPVPVEISTGTGGSGGDDRLTVAGATIPHQWGVDLHRLAIAEVAHRYARPLGRPVRVAAVDQWGRAEFVVHPNGATSDVRMHPAQTVTGLSA